MNKRPKREKNYDSDALTTAIVQGMLEKKAVEIAVMDMRNIPNAITDFFIICSGNSDTQIDAISDSVEEEVSKSLNQDPWHREGKQNKEWILLDYIDVVVHVFRKDRRKFYDIESLWGDAPTTIVPESIE